MEAVKITYHRFNPRSVVINENEGVVSDEAFTLEELSVLQHHCWMQAQATLSQKRFELLTRLENIFAALGNDTDAIILHVKEAGA